MIDLTNLNKLFSFSGDQQQKSKVEQYMGKDVKLDLTNFHKICPLSKGKQPQNKVKLYKDEDVKLDLTKFHKLCSLSKGKRRNEKGEKKFKSFKAYPWKTYERDEQKAIFDYARIRKELKWLFAIPNGGKRNILEAMNLKAQGLKPGVPDMFLPLARNGYHGLFIELKVGKNKTTPQQDEFIRDVRFNHYKCEVCYGAKEAIKVLEEYIQGKE